MEPFDHRDIQGQVDPSQFLAEDSLGAGMDRIERSRMGILLATGNERHDEDPG